MSGFRSEGTARFAYCQPGALDALSSREDNAVFVALIATGAYLLQGRHRIRDALMKKAPAARSKSRSTTKNRRPMAADGVFGTAAKPPVAARLTIEQKLVLRDIWVYACGLFAVTALIGLLISNFALLILAPVAAVCAVGGLLLHLATIERFSRARRSGTAASMTRIFG